LAPLLGGWLANTTSYQAVFAASFGCGIIAILVLHFLVRDPRQKKRILTIIPVPSPSADAKTGDQP
jgi:predicted MFS family arabinose efflux permease